MIFMCCAVGLALPAVGAVLLGGLGWFLFCFHKEEEESKVEGVAHAAADGTMMV